MPDLRRWATLLARAPPPLSSLSSLHSTIERTCVPMSCGAAFVQKQQVLLLLLSSGVTSIGSGGGGTRSIKTVGVAASARHCRNHTSRRPSFFLPATSSPLRTSLHHDHHLHTSASLFSMASATSFHDFKPLDKRGQPYPLEQLKGKVVLVVNTASKCGFTPQFGSLETLYKDVKAAHPDDFVILGFPCNQFGSQDPGSNDQIQEFCQLNYGVSFPVLGKIDVNGDKAEPLFEWLKSEKPGIMGLKRVKWNFEKFLIGRDGTVKGRWASTTKPEALKEVIEKELAAQ